MANSKGGKRPGAGRKPLGVKPRTVRLTDADVEVAKWLGSGNVSRGVRSALSLVKKP